MYCTLSDIQKVVPDNDLIQLTDDNVPPEVIVQANVDRAIADSGEVIDGYLRGRYALPLSPVPGLINTLAADIAVYRLYARRVKLTPPEGVSERYRNALKLLEQIQRGQMALGSAGVPGNTPAAGGGPRTSGNERVFTAEALKDYSK